jgi:hypothetical protein
VVDDTVLPALVEARRDAEEGRISSAEFTTILRSVREIAEDVVEDDEQAGAVQLETPLPVLIAPAKDAADQGAGELLSKLLDSENWQFEVAPAGILTSELIDRIDKFNPAILVIASIPPGGLTHARYLCKRIRRRFPELKMVIGRWADPAAETTALSEELRSSGADEITWTLSATGAHLNGWRTVFANGQAADQEQGGKTGPSIGTLSASV